MIRIIVNAGIRNVRFERRRDVPLSAASAAACTLQFASQSSVSEAVKRGRGAAEACQQNRYDTSVPSRSGLSKIPMKSTLTRMGAIAYKVARRAGVAHFEELLLLDRAPARSSWPVAPGYHIEALDDLAQFHHDSATPQSMLEPAMAQRLGDGRNHCFVARKSGDLAGYIWFAQQFIEASHNRGPAKHSGVAIAFPADMVFLYKAWIVPEHRGQGLFAALVGSSFDVWSGQGISGMLTTTEVINAPVLSVCTRLGFKRLGTCFRVGIGPLYGGISPRRSASQHRVTFGQRHALRPGCSPAAQ